MYPFLIVLMVIVAILMCFVVLIQNSKGGGLSSGFSSSNAIMGVRKTTDVLEKATWGLAACMVILSIASAHVVSYAPKVKDVIMEQAQQEEATNPYTMPSGTTAPATEAPAPAAEAPAPAAEAPAAPVTPAPTN